MFPYLQNFMFTKRSAVPHVAFRTLSFWYGPFGRVVSYDDNDNLQFPHSMYILGLQFHRKDPVF